MTTMQLWLVAGIPTTVVLIGILLNQFGLNMLSGRIQSVEARIQGVDSRLMASIKSLESGVEARLTVIEGDMRRFYQTLGIRLRE